MTLTLSEVQFNLTKVDFTTLPKPRKNKGVRGQLLELALGIPNSSKLTDMVDGELKSFTKGESIAVTQLKHTLPQIFDKTPFPQTKIGIKLQQTLYVGFDRQNNFLGTTTLTPDTNPKHYELLQNDYDFIANRIRQSFYNKSELHTTNGLNGLLQIRTKDSKDRNGNYHPIYWKGQKMTNKGFAFYLTGKYAKSII